MYSIQEVDFLRCESCCEQVKPQDYAVPYLCNKCFNLWLKDELITKEMKELGITKPIGKNKK